MGYAMTPLSWTLARRKLKNRRKWTVACLLGLTLAAVLFGFVDQDDLIERTHRGRHLLGTLDNCTLPAIEEFPHPLMPQYVRARGGLILHFMVAVYMFLALSIICDDFFVPALERMCEALSMSQDVAGATFMAAGSSAPELATAIIGVFVAKDDIGVSGVIGSAVFNIMFVISICAIFSGSVIYLTWWPLVRDCAAYLIAIFALLFTIANEQVAWYEAMIFLILYVGYIVLMYFNGPLERWANSFPLPLPATAFKSQENQSLMPYKQLDEEKGGKLYTDEKSPDSSVQSVSLGTIHPNPTVKTDPELPSLWEKPEGTFARLLWAASLPLNCAARYTIPDCRQERWQRWFLVTFFVSLIWISLFSYIMVWMITVIGFTLGIPDTIMGLTFVAAGVSIPDILTSLAVAKEGYGDMATSNAIGSNVFDILVCLGLPWFLQTAIVDPGSVVRVHSRGLTYSTLSLISTIIFLLGATHLNGWKLDKKYGVALLVWYFLFMIVASLYELNIFGDFNPPECGSTF